MKFSDDVIKNDEKAIFKLRTLYRKYGYKQYKMNKFEEYDLYLKNKDFLVSDGIITFNDTNGKLMALKPDVTLSIVKNSRDGELNKLYYSENVYRLSHGTHSFKEIMQTGLECIGNIDIYNICEVVMLAAESLKAISGNFVLDISHMGFVSAILNSVCDDESVKDTIIDCIGKKNLHEIKEICKNNNINSKALEKLVSTYGNGEKVLSELKEIAAEYNIADELYELETINKFLTCAGLGNKINFDFSIVNDMKYYSGVVFKGYIEEIYTSVLSGGEYTRLMRKMGKSSGAVGFAVYLDLLERLNTTDKKYDADSVILYDDGADAAQLFAAVKLIADGGASVIALKDASGVKYKQLLKFNGKGVEIIETND